MNKFLTPEQRDDLLLELKSKQYRRLADRIRVILLLVQGWLYKKIWEAFFIDEGTIRNWRKRYIDGGLERLMNDQWKAKTCSLSPCQLLELDSSIFSKFKSYRAALDIFSDVCSNFFRGIRKYKSELKTLLADNFQVIGT